MFRLQYVGRVRLRQQRGDCFHQVRDERSARRRLGVPRNDAMDARSFFATRVEPLKRNQFGANAGGLVPDSETL